MPLALPETSALVGVGSKHRRKNVKKINPRWICFDPAIFHSQLLQLGCKWLYPTGWMPPAPVRYFI